MRPKALTRALVLVMPVLVLLCPVDAAVSEPWKAVPADAFHPVLARPSVEPLVLDPGGRSVGYIADRAPMPDYPEELRAVPRPTGRPVVDQPDGAALSVGTADPPGRRADSGVVASGSRLSGRASWYCNADASRGPRSICTAGHPDTASQDAFAAAGPGLRDALGADWRGSVVHVNGVAVTLIDWCQCYKGESHEKLLDLYKDIFDAAGASGGVTISW